MTQVLAFIFMVVSSLFLMGDLVRQHKLAKELDSALDRGFLKFLIFIKDQQPIPIISFVFEIFRAIAIFAFVGIVMLFIVFQLQSPTIFLIFGNVFLVSLLFSFSLYWVLHYNNIFKRFSKILIFIGGAPLLLAILEYISGSNNVTRFISDELSRGLSPIISYTPENSLFIQALFITGIYMVYVVSMYFVSWLLYGSIALIAYSVIALPILIAKFVNKAFPEKPVVALFLAIWLCSTYYLTFA